MRLPRGAATVTVTVTGIALALAIATGTVTILGAVAGATNADAKANANANAIVAVVPSRRQPHTATATASTTAMEDQRNSTQGDDRDCAVEAAANNDDHHSNKNNDDHHSNKNKNIRALKRQLRLLVVIRCLRAANLAQPLLVPYYSRSLGLKPTGVLWLGSLYSAMVTVAELPSGILSDRLGRKTTLHIAFLGFASSLLLTALASCKLIAPGTVASTSTTTPISISISTTMPFLLWGCLGLAQFARAIGSSMYSGTDMAFLYEVIRKYNNNSNNNSNAVANSMLLSIESRNVFYTTLTEASAAAVGGWLSGAVGLPVVVALAAVPFLLGAVVALFFLESTGAASASASASASTSSTKTNAAVEDETSWVRSSFNVGGICCASEIFSIRKILSPLPGVQSVKVNVTTKIVLVGHRYDRIQASQIARSLTKEGFPAQIQRDGAKFDNSGIGKEKGQLQSAEAVAELLKGIQKSTFVESTLTLEGLRPNQSIEKAVADSFISHQVRAVYPSVISETIKVEHDPDLVTITEIRDVLRNYAVNKDGPRSFPPAVEVYINGADANLYLPCEKDYPNQPMIHRKEVGYVSWLKSRHVNVWLSGFFWILSMIRLADGKDQFKYFGLASVFFGLPPIMVKAYRTLRRCQFDANCMMVTAALGALALGEYDEAASVSFLFAVSEFLESSAAMKARKALSEICALRPDHANVIHPISKEIVVVPADRVPLGSTISVRTGDKIAADGVVVEGTTSVDESSLTGESTPVPKTIGDEVSGGTINIGQTQLVIKTKTTVEDSAVSKLIRLVEEAQSNPSPTENMVDSFARSYTPFVIVIAAFMCTIPWCFGTEIGRNWTMKGLIIVVIACPCALTISTPVTYAAGLAATAKRGVIIKGGAKLEAMGSVDRVVFDKTGTLTKGKFSVTHMEVIGNYKTRQEMLELLSLMQDRASHPIASSLVHAAKSEGVNIPRQMAISDHEILEGEGIAAKVDGQVQVYVGNQRLFKRLGLFQLLSTTNKNIVEEWEDTGGTVGFIGTNKQIIGMFCVKDSVREEAKEALQELEEAQIETFMCTGDSNTTAQAVAKEIGIPNHRVNSQLLPQDKLDFVKTLRRPEPKKFALCQKKQYVLFCGDGVNDAPALAGVHISVSMGGGAAMALELSDVTLMDSRLTKLPYVIKMGQRVLTTVKENIILSFVAKFAVILLTFMGKMTLLYAIASDVGIMLLVTLNGMKLLPNDDYDPVEPEQNRRGRTIGNRLNFLGKNAGYELIRFDDSTKTKTR